MKLNPYDIDIQPEELAQLNTPDSFKNSLSYDDVQLSKDLPIVVKYDYIDLDVTDYHFKQEFLLRANWKKRHAVIKVTISIVLISAATCVRL